jgi:nitrate reductase assembly molybdenum cofactor insertion protein NarJ
MTGACVGASCADWLGRSARWRLASLLFQLPTPGSMAEIQALSDVVGADALPAVECLVAVPFEAWQVEYHRVLGPGGVPACESSYDDNALAGRGPLLSRVAGYYEAFAYRPDEASPEVPDHISTETGFLSYLAFKVAFAIDAHQSGPRSVAEEAYGRFADEHLGYWLARFDERIEASGSQIYQGALTYVAGLCGAAAPDAASDQNRTSSST